MEPGMSRGRISAYARALWPPLLAIALLMAAAVVLVAVVLAPPWWAYPIVVAVGLACVVFGALGALGARR
jgi:hypothetical protein